MNIPITAEEADRIALERGFRYEVLLNDPTFAEIINGLSDAYSNAIINTSPTESAKREYLYHLHRALQDIVHSMNAAVAMRYETEQRLQAEESPINEDNF